MSIYISLVNWTDQGIRHVKEAAGRLDDGIKATEEAGGKMLAWYLTMGRYDALIIYDFPDDETAAGYFLKLGSLGNVRTETLKTYTEDQFRNIVAKL